MTSLFDETLLRSSSIRLKILCEDFLSCIIYHKKTSKEKRETCGINVPIASAPGDTKKGFRWMAQFFDKQLSIRKWIGVL